MDKDVNLRIYAKNLRLTDDIKEHIENQSKNIIKNCDNGSDLSVVVSRTKNTYKTEITAKYIKRIIRVEKTHNGLKKCITAACGIMETKIAKFHDKIIDKRSHISNVNLEYANVENSDFKPIKNKCFKLQPMTPQEACLEMEMLGHSFFVFINDLTGKTAVVYKRNDDAFGIIEGE